MANFFGGDHFLSGDVGGTDPFGSTAARQANAANEQRYRQALGLWNKLGSQQEQAYNRAGGYYSQMLPSINKGYGAAKSNLFSAGNQAKLGIMDRGKQDLAGSQQSLASRGLYNSTAFDAASRGIHADTSRALASVDENLGQLLANLQIGQGQAQAGAYSQLGGFEQSRFASQAGITQGKIGTITGREDKAGGGILGGSGGAGLGALLALI